MLNPQALPPTPTSVNDIPPPSSPAGTVLPQMELKDVIAEPLYAYVKQAERLWENYDRRDQVLSATANWRLIAAATITPDTPFNQSITIEEGVTSTETQERTFATELGVNASIPNVGLGASISMSISEKTGQSISFTNRKTTMTNLTASTKDPRAVFWFWQLDVDYLIAGVKVTWEVTNSNGIGQLTGNDSRAVLTRDGEGRERANRRQVSGARRRGTSNFSSPLAVGGTILVATQFPSAGSVDSILTDQASGQPIEIMSYPDLLQQQVERAA